MKKVSVNVMTGLLTVAMMASMAVPTFAAELTSAEIAGADTVNGTYNVYEGTDADSDGEIDAGKASSVVIVDAEATTFKVTVPIALHVAQDANGDKTYADDFYASDEGMAKIINECALGQVRITDVKVVPAAGYTVTDFEADYANMKVNSKNFGFKINGLVAAADTGVVLTANATEETVTTKLADTYANDDNGLEALEADFESIVYSAGDKDSEAFPVITNSSILPIFYEAKLPAYSQAVTNANVGGVVFTIDFN